MSKNMSGEYSQKLLDHTKQSSIGTGKTVSKRAIQKTAEITVDLTNQFANRVAKVSKKIAAEIIQKQLQIAMIKNYLKKDIRLQKKDRKLLTIWDEYISVIMEYQENKKFVRQ